MIRKLLEKKPQLKPLVSALDTFLFEVPEKTKGAPHVRDSVDLKRWMILVVIALLPCTLMAIWNTGLQKMVYGSGNFHLMDAYLSASSSFGGYFEFCFAEGRWLTILGYGLGAFLPIVLISYAVGGLWEGIFAVLRGHEIAEGFLVTGILYALILPPTIPYWMVAVGVSFGVVIGKELFGGTGMNILNPALTCRVFLFFTFPGQMTGQIWAGTNPTKIANSISTMNAEAKLPAWDGYTQATPLAKYNIADDIKRIHVDAIATNSVGTDVGTIDVIQQEFTKWEATSGQTGELGSLTGDQLHDFVTEGLGLSPDSYTAAYDFAGLQHGVGDSSNWNLFFGNRLGSLGETSILFSLLGAAFLLWVGIASWRTMVSIGLSAFIVAWIFQLFAENVGVDGGAWNPARYALPAYKQLLMGSLMFGLVFMATEPVSSPYMRSAKWVYGIMIGAMVIFIRAVNPAFPEGVMLAILFANVFAPLFDYYALRHYRRRRRVPATS